MRSQNSSRLQFLESIRGLAALVVVFYHSILAFWPYMLEPESPRLDSAWPIFRAVARSPLTVLFSGQFAVVVFFVLSGFVLSYSWFKTNQLEPLTAAALRRYFRLAVPVTTSVLISYLLMRLHAYHNVRAAALSGSGWLGAWMQFPASLFANDYTGAVRQGLYGSFVNAESNYNNVLWTMAIELPGSFIIYALLALFGGVRNRWIIYLAFGIFLAWGLDHMWLCDFVIGMALCDAYVNLEVRQQLFDLGWFALPLMVLGLAIGGYRGYPAIANWPAFIPYSQCLTAGAFLIVGVPLFSASVRRWMETGPLSWLGRISFGLYLIHMPILLSLSSAVYVYFRDVRGWHLDAAARGAIAAELLASLLAGWLMYYIADLPSISLGRKIARHFFEPRVRAPNTGLQ